MRIYYFVILSFVLFLYSCNKVRNKDSSSDPKINSDSTKNINNTQSDTAKKLNYFDETLKSVPKNIQPVMGYRFIISGDFDGDGKKEQIMEHFISQLDHKETNKFYDSLTDYDQLVALTMKKWPYSFAVSDNKSIDTLRISSDIQLLGLSYLKNEGDLNGDGTDEISYVVQWADWSNLNTWHIKTYKNKKWGTLYSFSIWDWQLPDLPETFNQYGLFGLEDKIINTSNNKANKQLEKQLIKFEGLVKKMKTNKIRVIFRNDEAELDTMIVDLKKVKQ